MFPPPAHPPFVTACVRATWTAAARARAVAAVLVLTAAAGATSAAQEPEPPTAAPPPITERKPEIHYLQDDAGRLVPVPGFRYRDFVELLRLKEGLPGLAQPPGAVLEEIVVRGDLTKITAGACPVEVVCTIRQSRRGWVDVPLACPEIVLTGGPAYAGPGRCLVDPLPDQGGYRAWIEAPPGEGVDARHVVTLTGRLPIERSASHESLTLRLPPATASLLELRSSRRDPDVVVRPAAADRQVRDDGDGAVVKLSGITGPAMVRVGQRAAADAGRGAAAEATVESVVRIDGRNAVTQARVTIAGLPPRTDTVRIALPPEATLRGVRPPATVVDRGGDDKPFVVVAIARGADGQAVVDLECERPLRRAAGKAQAGPFELAGFAVEGIEPWRQWGRISLIVEGEWQATWNDDLRRVDPPAAGRQPGLVAAFAYDLQPASLQVRVSPRPSRVVIEPEYRYDVSAERIGMQARLRVLASGGPATEIGLDLDPAWVIDEVGPPGLVDTAGVITEGKRTRIPFVVPLVGDAVIEIRAGQTLKREAQQVGWRLPIPLTGLVGPASVAIAAASDIELLPVAEQIKGLIRQPAAALSRADMDAVVLAYRLDARQGEFAATRRYLTRRVDANVAVQAVMDEAATAVTETIRLDVRHVPLEFVEMLVPEAILAAGGLRARQDAWVLDPVEVPAEVAAPGIRRLRMILPGPLLGAGEITLLYSLPAPPVPPEATVAHDLPLIRPDVDRITRQTFRLEAPERLAVEVRDDTWRREAGEQTAVTTRVWSSTRPQEAVPLALSTRQRVAVGGLAVDVALLRTTVLAGRREDAFTYALSGVGERLRMELPDGVSEIRVDGQPAATTQQPDGGVLVELPQKTGHRWLLEVYRIAPVATGWGALAARLGLPARVPLEPPQFADGVVVRRFSWEIESRPDEWLFGVAPTWTSQQVWRWRGLVPRPEPAVSQQSLAAWVRAAADGDDRRPTDAAADGPTGRRAVYTGVGAPGSAGPWLLPTWFLVLVCSGLSLVVGLTGPLVPASRRPWLLGAGAAAAVLAAAAAPDLAPLAALAALPGAALAGLGWLTRRITDTTSPVKDRSGSTGNVSASSLTRAVGSGSLIIAGSAVSGEMPPTSGR